MGDKISIKFINFKSIYGFCVKLRPFNEVIVEYIKGAGILNNATTLFEFGIIVSSRLHENPSYCTWVHAWGIKYCSRVGDILYGKLLLFCCYIIFVLCQKYSTTTPGKVLIFKVMGKVNSRNTHIKLLYIKRQSMPKPSRVLNMLMYKCLKTF